MEIALPPFDVGMLKFTVARALPATAVTLVGAPGMRGLTVRTVLTAPHVMVAVPDVVPVVMLVPVTWATEVLLLLQLPSVAPVGLPLMIVVPPKAIVEGVRLIEFRTAIGKTLLDAEDEEPVPALLVAVTVNV